VQAPTVAQTIKKLKDEIKAIENENRNYQKIRYPGYPAQKAHESRRIRIVEIQQEIRALLKSRSN